MMPRLCCPKPELSLTICEHSFFADDAGYGCSPIFEEVIMYSPSAIRTGKLVVDPATKEVTVDGRRLHLTGKQYDILELLSVQKGATLTKEMILNHLYGGIDGPEFKIIDVFVCKLRKKLTEATGGRHYIETVWGRGYALRDPASDARGTNESWHRDPAPALQ
jgi:DNA-binding winged helix-turn-helix (wHTH) protein